MLTVGLVIGNLTAGVRYQARVARYREQRTRHLYEDVYKRQVTVLTGKQVLKIQASAAVITEYQCVIAVSYTHLDLPKDQTIHCRDRNDDMSCSSATALIKKEQECFSTVSYTHLTTSDTSGY